MNIANVPQYKTAKLVNLFATTLIRAFLSIPFVKSAAHNLILHSLLLLKETIHVDLHNETTQSPTHRANR